MYSNLTPNYLSSLIPQQVESISQYNLRNAQDLRNIRTRTSLYYSSFLPSTLGQWNNLSIETRQSNSLSSFKWPLKKDKSSVPRYFYSGKKESPCTSYTLTHGMQLTKSRHLLKKIFPARPCAIVVA